MADIRTLPMKHIFIDVVGYTNNRSVEAQAIIIDRLNTSVVQTTEYFTINKKNILYIPTGDGLCISFINLEEPYDIYMQYAIKLLENIGTNNKYAENEDEVFSVRIGINSNCDNIIKDINGLPNISGSGINIASRIMNCADANQIIVSAQIYEVLRGWRKYLNMFKSYTAKIKHNITMPVYQYIDSKVNFLSTSTPILFEENKEDEVKNITELLACYCCFAVKYKKILLEYRHQLMDRACFVLLWSLAKDEYYEMHRRDHEYTRELTYKKNEATFREQVKYYNELGVYFLAELVDMIKYCYEFDKIEKYFDDSVEYLTVINEEGKNELKTKWKELCSRIGIDSLLSDS